MNPVHVVCECKYLSDLAATRVGAGPGVYAIITARFLPLTANMHAIIEGYPRFRYSRRPIQVPHEWRERTKHLSPPRA